MTHITTRDGKYTVIHENGANLRAERYGEPWRDLSGDGLVLALAQEIERLRAALHDIADMTSPWHFETTHFGKVLHAVEPDGTRHTVAFGDMSSAAGIALLNAMVRDLTNPPQKGSNDERSNPDSR